MKFWEELSRQERIGIHKRDSIQGSRDRHKSFPILRGHYKSKKLQITVRPRQDWLVFQDLGRRISGSIVSFRWPPEPPRAHRGLTAGARLGGKSSQRN